MKRTANDPIQEVKVVSGIPVYIEWPKGSTRIYKRSGKEVLMHADYGYIPKTEGADGEELDVYVGEDLESPLVFQLHQKDPDNESFDENKYMIGFASGEDAKTTYLMHVPEDRFGGMEEMTWDNFKKLLGRNQTQQKQAAVDNGEESKYEVGQMVHLNDYTNGRSYEGQEADGKIVQSIMELRDLDRGSEGQWHYQIDIYGPNEETGVLEPTGDLVWAWDDDIARTISGSVKKAQYEAKDFRPGEYVTILTIDEIGRVMEVDEEYQHVKVMDEHGQTDIYVPDQLMKTGKRRRKSMNGNSRTGGYADDWAANDANGQPLEEGDQVKNADPGPNDDPDMVYTIIGYSYPQLKVKDTNGEVGYAMPSGSVKVASKRTAGPIMEGEEVTFNLQGEEHTGLVVQDNGDETVNLSFIDGISGPPMMNIPKSSLTIVFASKREASGGVSASEQGGNLVITVDPETQQEVKELVESGDTSDQAMWNLFDTPGFLGSGYEPTAPEAIGALTSAPIIGHDGKYYWYPQYESRSPLEDLAESGRTVFQGAPVEKGAMKKTAGSAADKIMEINSEISDLAGNPQSGTFLRQEPWASRFADRVRNEVGTVDDNTIRQLEDENFHSAIYVLVMNGLTTGDYYTKETYAMNKKADGYGSWIEKYSPEEREQMQVEVIVHDEQGALKRNVFDNIEEARAAFPDLIPEGEIRAMHGVDQATGQDILRYESPEAYNQLSASKKRRRTTAMKKIAEFHVGDSVRVMVDGPENGAVGIIQQIFNRPVAPIVVKFNQPVEGQGEVGTYEENELQQDAGAEPDPMNGPSGMFAGAEMRTAGHGLMSGDTVRVVGDLPEGSIGSNMKGRTGTVTNSEGTAYPDNPFEDFNPGEHVMVEIDGTELQFPTTALQKVASRRKAGADDEFESKVRSLKPSERGDFLEDGGEWQDFIDQLVGPGQSSKKNDLYDQRDQMLRLMDQNYRFDDETRQGSCPPGLSKEVKDKVKKEYGPDDPKTYQTLWKIKDEQKKGSVKTAEEDALMTHAQNCPICMQGMMQMDPDSLCPTGQQIFKSQIEDMGGEVTDPNYGKAVAGNANEIKIGHEVYVKDLGINAHVKMIEGGMITISSQEFGDHYYVVGDDNVVRRRRRHATDQQEINDLERMKLRLEEQTKETEDETQMRALEERLQELDMELDRANAKQAMENPNFWNKVGEEDIDGGTDKKLRSPATEEISERGHDEQRAHPAKGVPGEGTEFRHELARRKADLQDSDPGFGSRERNPYEQMGNQTKCDQCGMLGFSAEDGTDCLNHCGGTMRTAEESAPPTMGGMPENVEQKVDAGEAGPAKFALDKDMFKSEDQVRMEANEDAVAGPKKGTDFDEGGYESSGPFIAPSAMPGQEM